LLVSIAVAIAVAAPVAGAAKPTPPQPLAISSSTLRQSGQQLVWTVQAAAPFVPKDLSRTARSLCLLIERDSAGDVRDQVCVTGPRSGGRSPRLTVAPVSAAGAGPPRLIDAVVTRSTASELSASFAPASIGIGYESTHWQTRSTLEAPPCVAPAGQTLCQSLFPATPALAKLHTPQLVGCVASGASSVTTGPSTGKEIALTFDDGPWTDTGQFLDLLERYHVPATFFEIGEHISTYGHGGAIERRMLADGDMIGDHTWSHQNVSRGGALARREILDAAAAIKSVTHGFEPCLFRAPFGAVGPRLFAVTRSLGFTTIQWDVDPRDWALPGTNAIITNVLTHAHPGAIVLQHDGGGNRSETLAALPVEIAALKRRGYHFVTITQMFGMQLLYR
jgi:peptidoglycan/xylan/chitin deacetylase (PgdA/CDA1 family)